MAAVVKEYGGAVLAAVGGVVFLGTLGQFLLSRQGLIMQMTGGRVVILGKTGKNFAAGMSGGIAYVLDEDNDLYMRTNKSMVFSEEVTNKYDVLELKEMIKEHVTLTNSEKGKEILDHFSEYLPKFKKVIPYDYNRMQMAIVQMEEKGLNAEQAQIEAFYASTRA